MINSLFCYFVSGEQEQVFPGSRLWQSPLSGKPSDATMSTPSEFTIGDYFTACTEFLCRDHFSVLKAGLAGFSGNGGIDDLQSIQVYLEKHGAFYHPLKISVNSKDNQAAHFVLNGAVSDQGLSVVQTEYQLISSLNKKGLNNALPQVYGSGLTETGKGRVGFFLGSWFEGFKEFHTTHHKGKDQIVIWDSDGTCRYMSVEKALPIYREIAKILTDFYDIETFEQIYPWHHAAGDFIAGFDNDKIQVRLITVRGYAPFTAINAPVENKISHILPSLLLFFIHLTVRMRLDRIDGTGQLAMIDEQVIRATTDGFLQALEKKTLTYDYGDIRETFGSFFKQFDWEQLKAIMENILESYDSRSVEIQLIQENLEAHCKIVQAIFKSV